MCASYSRYYWGLKLYLVCAGDGMPIMWCLAHPKIGEREVVAALLEHDQHLIRDGQVMLADEGFSGKDFAATTAAHGIELLRPDRLDETYRNGNLGGVRQWIEWVNQTLKGQLDLEHSHWTGRALRGPRLGVRPGCRARLSIESRANSSNVRAAASACRRRSAGGVHSPRSMRPSSLASQPAAPPCPVVAPTLQVVR